MTQPPYRVSAEGRGPVPIVFGVTGHRDLRSEDIGRLEQAVRAIFIDVAKKHPHTPLVLFSPLAEGADRLAARVALELGIRLVVPMPFERVVYERDFQTPVLRAEFHDLLKKAPLRFKLPLLPGYTENEVKAAGEARNRHYAQVGAYIARHSHILIALWDGEKSDNIGGTAHVVKFKLEGVSEPYGPRRNPLDPVESGPVYHIVTPRKRNPPPADALRLRKLYPPGHGNPEEADRAYRRILARIETFNRDALRLKPADRNPLFTDADIARMQSNTAKGILDWFTIADRLALRFQRRDHRTLVGLVLLSIATAVLLQVASATGPTGWYFAYQACLAALYGLYGLNRWRDFHGKYLDYRALAEGLRVQLFWWLAGIQDSVADHYLRKQRGELDWIRQAIRTRTIQATSDNVRLQRKPLRSERAELVFRCWVQGQAAYFAKSGARNARWSRWVRRVSYVAAAVPVLLVGVKWFMGAGHPLLLGMGFFLVVAAALLVYARVQAYAEHSKHFERMHRLFERAQDKLREFLKPGENRHRETQNLLLDLGKEALIENSDWVLLHRERPPEPKG